MATAEKFDDDELVVRGGDGLVVTGGIRRGKGFVTVAWKTHGVVVFGTSFEEQQACDLELALKKVRRWFEERRLEKGAGDVER
jgi:hypothetical protein